MTLGSTSEPLIATFSPFKANTSGVDPVLVSVMGRATECCKPEQRRKVGLGAELLELSGIACAGLLFEQQALRGELRAIVAT